MYVCVLDWGGGGGRGEGLLVPLCVFEEIQTRTEGGSGED